VDLDAGDFVIRSGTWDEDEDFSGSTTTHFLQSPDEVEAIRSSPVVRRRKERRDVEVIGLHL